MLNLPHPQLHFFYSLTKQIVDYFINLKMKITPFRSKTEAQIFSTSTKIFGTIGTEHKNSIQNFIYHQKNSAKIKVITYYYFSFPKIFGIIGIIMYCLYLLL